MSQRPVAEFTTLAVTPLQQNCTLFWCAKSRKGVAIDPGGETERILARADELEVAIERVLLTHLHIDHVGAAGRLATRCRASILGPHQDDRFLLATLPQQGLLFGVELEQPFTPDQWLEGGDVVPVGELELAVRHCPGHTPGHVIYFNLATSLAITGDVLFNGSIGRTDFPGGDHLLLLRSIRNQLWTLGDEVTFIPGHGPFSTFGKERRSNPFVAD